MAIDEAALSAFAAAFESVARETLTPAHLRRSFETDGALQTGELTFAFAKSLQQRVWGQGFPAPAFDDQFDVVSQRAVADKHVKLCLSRAGERFEAIVFHQTESLPARIHAAYRPEVHEWNRLEALELVVEHWLPVD